MGEAQVLRSRNGRERLVGRGGLSSEGVSFCHCGKRLERIDLKEERISGLTIGSHLGVGVRQTGDHPVVVRRQRTTGRVYSFKYPPPSQLPHDDFTSILKVLSPMAPQADGQDFSM